METTLITLGDNSEVYMEGIETVLCHIQDNEPAYIINNTPYVKMASYINGLYGKIIISSVEFTEEQHIKLILPVNTVDMELLHSIGHIIDYPIVHATGIVEKPMIDDYGEYHGSYYQLSATLRKGN